jgi:hypothetical protein
MAYRVFISHSVRDQRLVIMLSRLLAEFGVEPVVAEWYLSPGEPLADKIVRHIDGADCVVALLTSEGIRSNWVHQEVGIALKNPRKPVIPLVEKGTSAGDLAALHGKEYIEYDPRHPFDALQRAATHVRRLHLAEEERRQGLLLAGAIVAFLLLLAGDSDDSRL